MRRAAVPLLVAAMACGSRTGLDVAAGGTESGDSGLPAMEAGTIVDASVPDASTVETSVPDASAPIDVTCPHAPGVQAGAPWPVWRRCPGRAANTPVVGPLTEPRVAWRAAATWGPGLVIAADGTIYASSDAGLVALASDGSTRWTTPFVNIKDLAIGADGNVYVSSDTGLSAVRPDGSVAWTAQSCWPPLALGLGAGALYALMESCTPNTPSSLVAFAPDGTQRWKAQLDVFNAAPLAIGADGTVYLLGVLPSPPLELEAIDPSGSLGWTLAAPGGIVFDPYNNSPDGPMAADDGSIAFVDTLGLHSVAPDGSAQWSVSLGGPHGLLAAATDGTLYVGAAPYKLVAIRSNGSSGWEWGDVNETAVQPIVGGDGTLYAADGTGTVAISRDGVLMWKLEALGTPVAIGADGTLYVRSAGEVVALRE